MDNRTDYFLKILETIGVPLMSAIVAKGDGQSETTAQHMAELLTKSVEASIGLGPLVELEKLGDQTDSVRVALAGLASQVLADLYQESGTVPQTADINRIRDGFQAVITFADNFTASDDAVMRLSALDADGHSVDAPQSQVQYIKSFVPVIRAVAEFSFGKPGPQLLADIASRLSAKAQEIRAAQFGAEGTPDDHKRIERGIVSALADLYASCHVAETQRLSADTQSDDSAASFDKVWDAFDLQAQILEALVQTIVPGGAPVAAETPVAAPASPIAGIGKKPDAEAAPPLAAPTTKAAPPPSGGNPMSFFSAPSDDDDEPAAKAEEQPAAPATPPPAPATEEPAKDESKDESDKGSGDAGGNPMSFFKKG